MAVRLLPLWVDDEGQSCDEDDEGPPRNWVQVYGCLDVTGYAWLSYIAQKRFEGHRG